MLRKIMAFLLAILFIMSVCVVGVSADEAEPQENVIYFRVPENWNGVHRVFCHITIIDTGVSFENWCSKKESCTNVEGNLYAYDLSKAGIEIMDECMVEFITDTGLQTHPLMLRYDGVGATAYCDGTVYENVYDYNKNTYAAFWEGEDPAENGPVMMISATGNIVGTCRSEFDETQEKMFRNFLDRNLIFAQQDSGKTDQQLIDDIIKPLGISESTADKIIRSVGGITLAWGDGYGGAEKPLDEWIYEVVDGEVILKGFRTVYDEVNIPDSIDGMPVTGIDSSSFFNIYYFKEKIVNIPASVTNITTPIITDYIMLPISAFNVHEDNPAYSSADGILYSKDKKTLYAYPTYKKDKVCTLDEATETICEYAFFGGRFEEILLPDTLKTVSDNAFFRCVSLKELNLPASVTHIDGNAFVFNRGITAVNVDPENKNYCSVDGVLYNKDKTEILYFPIANGLIHYEVLDGVKRIGAKAFQSSSSPDEIVLPESVEEIGYRAFYGCSADVNIPEGVKAIAEEAFFASNITKAIVPESITEIGYRTFASASIDEIDLPYGLTIIGKDAFMNNPVKSVVIPGTVTTIEDGAFNSCYYLSDITIPESVTYMGEELFDYCSEDLIIYGKEGSVAEKYAKDHNIKFASLSSEVLMGDSDKDGRITVKDATLIQKHTAGIVTLGEAAVSVSDVTGDGKVNVKDATLIQKFVAGIVDKF